MIDWLAENWLLVVPWVITIAGVIVKLTPNETDNKILEIFIKIFEQISLSGATPPVNSQKKT